MLLFISAILGDPALLVHSSPAGSYATTVQARSEEMPPRPKLRATIGSGHSAGVTSVAFSPDFKIFASASGDTTIRLWDVATGKELATLEGHKFPISGIWFSPDGKT